MYIMNFDGQIYGKHDWILNINNWIPIYLTRVYYPMKNNTYIYIYRLLYNRLKLSGKPIVSIKSNVGGLIETIYRL